MNIIRELLYALWQQDFEKLADPNLIWIIYLLVLIILFLENGLLPAAFLPGDSLLILLGILISKGTLNFYISLLLLTIAASMGSWVGYLQGKWLENNQLVKSWIAYLPVHYSHRAYSMFHRHGFASLFIGRFIAFIRTLLPIIIGLSGLSSSRFQFFNWISAFLWVFTLTLIGFIFGKTSIFRYYEENLMFYIILLPLILLIIGLISLFLIVLRCKYSNNSNNK